MKSATYSVPLTCVPDPADGVLVTLTVAVWPGLMTTVEKVVAGLTAASSRSPVLEVTAPSNALAATDMDMLTVPAGAPEGYGPISLGVANQNPSLRFPPGEVYEPDGVVPIELTR